MSIRIRIASLLALLGCGLIAVAGPVPTAASRESMVGQPLPGWRAGMLDIHQISIGGKGDAAFFIFPDGTTMLLDAGEMVRNRPPSYDAPMRPDDSLRSGQWIAQYIQHVHPQGKRGAIDYALLTHFHEDHMGLVTEQSPLSTSGAYRLTGITDVAEDVPIRRVLDLGWPNYDFPPSLHTPPSNYAALVQWRLKHATLTNYRAFLQWQHEHRGLQAEQFRPGRRNQVRLQHAADKYPHFEIRNLAANGWVWKGEGETVRNRYPEGQIPDENNCSLAFRLSYGAFRYFNGGDMAGRVREGKAWSEMESAMAWVTGPVDAYALNHHGVEDSTNVLFLSVLQPRIHIVSVYASSQPDLEVMRRILSEHSYPGPRDVFLTNGMWEGRRKNMVKRYGEKDTGWLVEQIGKIASSQGHVVVRVEPGGASYRVIIVDDGTAPPGNVLSVHGPYPSCHARPLDSKG